MNRMFSSSQTIVGILGTLHTEDLRTNYDYPLELLEKKISDFKPDLICGEVRPEDWDRYISDSDYTGYLGPSEYRDSIIPLCEKNGIQFVPVDWFEWDLTNLSHFHDFTKEKQERLELELKERYRLIFSIAHKGKTPFNCLEVDNHVKAKHDLLSKINPEVQNLTWVARNQIMLHRIYEAINSNQNKRILCVAGFEHNYYYFQKLKERVDIQILYPLDKNILSPENMNE
ncbi:hypothetical protein [Salinibacillus xinjiangensis]|uniref:hypothetical protein n=1 Tax=Salinibacillus xinjiangensis TaxID=1229268 RepID=UPI0018916422|nr:hypothetical protein [Salinibacillus xinjiangensis]